MKNNVRFRILLPILLLVLSIVLDKAGDLQMNRLSQLNINKYDFMEHPLPQDYAIARYIDYGLNSPAWLLSQKLPSIFPQNVAAACCGFIRGEADWEYFSLVVLTWFLIGLRLDKRRSYQETEKPAGDIWLSRVLRGLCGFFGLFLCYSAIELYLAPAWNYPRWVVVPVGLWGAALILGSLYPFSPARTKTWSRALGIFIVTAGVFYSEAAIRLFRFRSSFGVSTVALLSVWGVAAIIGGAYLLAHAGKALKQPV
jgi:hypothetical protein